MPKLAEEFRSNPSPRDYANEYTDERSFSDHKEVIHTKVARFLVGVLFLHQPASYS